MPAAHKSLGENRRKKLNLEKTLWTSGLVFLVRYVGDVAVGFIFLLIELGLNAALAYMTH